MRKVRANRNVVRERVATLEAVKPIRLPDRVLQRLTPVRFVFA